MKRNQATVLVWDCSSRYRPFFIDIAKKFKYLIFLKFFSHWEGFKDGYCHYTSIPLPLVLSVFFVVILYRNSSCIS